MARPLPQLRETALPAMPPRGEAARTACALPARFVGVGVVGRWRERFEGEALSSPKLFTVRTSEKGTSGGEDEVLCLLDR
jgi:hypothetical protein